MVICELEVNPHGRMHINRLVKKLPPICLTHLIDETNPLMFTVHGNYINKINRSISSGSALQYGLRKFEVFLFDRESYDNVKEDEFLKNMYQDSKKLLV